MPEKPIALLFDLDGTLVDSLPDLAAALNVLVAEQGRPALSEDAVAAMVGNGVEKLVERAWAATGQPAGTALKALTNRFREIYFRDPVAHTRLYPQVLEIVRHFASHGHPMAVVTNKPLAPTEVILQKLGLAEFFPVVIGGDSTPFLKPAAEPIVAAMRGLQVMTAVMIGDSPADVGAARAAGIPVIALSGGYRSVAADTMQADALIDGFDELPAALDSLINHR